VTLFETVRGYVEQKRTFGLDYGTPARCLRSFAKDVGDKDIGSIVPRQVSAHLNRGRSSTTTWRMKYKCLRNFFEYWAARGEIETLPLPPIRPAVPQTFVPYIYSKKEIRTLLQGTRRCQRDSRVIDARTLRMFTLFLYATGALTGEVFRLRREALDLKAGFITLGGGRFHRSRRIPIGPDLRSRLERYLGWTAHAKSQGRTLFSNKDKSPINVVTLAKSFQRLRRLTGILRHDTSRLQPRLHDLRHTFAVHRITSWLKQGADMDRMLPALAVYIGQVGLGSTERYLALTPERFRKHLVRLSPRRRKGRKRWRDDAALMKFLAEL
jgi:integrase/recombinase XerD